MKIFLAALFISSLAQALPATLNFQARIRVQDGQVLEKTDVNFFFEYTSPDGACVLYQETYDHQNMYGSGGLVSFQLGVGIDNPTTGYRQIFTSGATLKDTFKNGGTYTCKDGSTYTPGVNDIRKLAVKFSYTGSGGWNEVAGIKINSVPFAMYASEAQNTDNLGGVAAALYTKFSDFSTCTGGQVLTYNGTAFSCVAPGTAANFSGVLAGDVSGTQSATVVDTVGGKTAAQVSTSVDDTTNATNAATASRIVKRDGSGNASFNTAQANNFSGRNLLLYEATNTNHVAVHAPSTFTAGDYVLTLPQNAGSAGYVLSTNGSGVTSWISPTTGNVTSVGASAPLVSTGGQTPNISLPAATASVDGYLSAADFTTFSGKVSSQWTTSAPNIYYNTGNVGVGTSSPSTMLDVNGAATFGSTGKVNISATGVISSNVSNNYTPIVINNPTGYAHMVVNSSADFGSNGSDAYIKLHDNTKSVFLDSAGIKFNYGSVNEGMRITNTGLVGIGTAAPTFKLEVAGDIHGDTGGGATPSLSLEHHGSNFIVRPVSGGSTTTVLENTGGGGLSLNPSGGNVGVGTNAPAYKVDVAGDVNITGNFKVNGVNIATGGGTVTSVGATLPLTSTGGNTPTIAMPAAATAQDGYLTSTDWNTFNNKLGTASAFAGDVTGTAGATVVEKIRGTNVAITSITSGNFLKYNGTNWVNSTPVIGDVTGLTTALSNKLDVANMPASCNASSTLTFSSPSGAWTCSAIAGLDASVITAGTIDAARLPASANYWQPVAGGIGYVGGNLEIDNMQALRWKYANTDMASIRFESTGNGAGQSKLILETQDDADEPISFRQSGLERMVIGTAGYVGINTPSPQSTLDVNGDIQFGPANTGRIKSNGVDTLVDAIPAGSSVVFRNNGSTEKMRIDPNGNLGIGATAPASKLEVRSPHMGALSGVTQTTTNAGILINSDLVDAAHGPGVFWTTEDNKAKPKAGMWMYQENGPGSWLMFGTSNAYATGITNNAMAINPIGNVGIGTSNPTAKLEVAGDIAVGSDSIASTGTYGSQIRFLGANSDDQWIARYNETSNITDLRVNLGDDTVGVGTDKFSIGATISNVYHTAMTVLSNGQVGIGTRTPAAALDVIGQIRPSMGTPLVNPASNNVDFTTGNTQYVTLSSCPGNAATVNLFSMLEGGSYSLIITSPANCLVDFTGISHPIGGSGGVTVNAFKYPAGQKFSSTGNPVVYSFLRANNFVFVAQVVDFQ